MIERVNQTRASHKGEKETLVGHTGTLFDYWQADGTAAPFVRVDLVSEAPLPGEALYRHRNTLMVGGMLLGLIAGDIWVDFRAREQNEVKD